MKIERISENQIRCTLNQADLADKELLLTELAYGTDKAKELFRELMQQAATELGFEVDNIPLMIEAIPVSKDCLVLIITKVEDPEELDTRFSRFTKPIEDIQENDDFDDDESDTGLSGKSESMVDEILGALGNLANNLNAIENARFNGNRKASAQNAKVTKAESFRIFAFKKLDDVILSAKLVDGIYKSDNTLYKNPKDSQFYLYMTKNNNTDGDFMRVCNIIGEHGNKIRATYAARNHMDEHYKIILDSYALQKLADV